MTLSSSPNGGFREKVDTSEEDREELVYGDVSLERKLLAISRLALEALYDEHKVPDTEMAKRLATTLEENQQLRASLKRLRDDHADALRARDQEISGLRRRVRELEDIIHRPREDDRRNRELDHLMRARPMARG